MRPSVNALCNSSITWLMNHEHLFFVTVRGWLKLIPFFSAVGGVSYVTYRFIVPKSVSNFIYFIFENLSIPTIYICAAMQS